MSPIKLLQGRHKVGLQMCIEMFISYLIKSSLSTFHIHWPLFLIKHPVYQWLSSYRNFSDETIEIAHHYVFRNNNVCLSSLCKRIMYNGLIAFFRLLFHNPFIGNADAGVDDDDINADRRRRPWCRQWNSSEKLFTPPWDGVLYTKTTKILTI